MPLCKNRHIDNPALNLKLRKWSFSHVIKRNLKRALDRAPVMLLLWKIDRVEPHARAEHLCSVRWCLALACSDPSMYVNAPWVTPVGRPPWLHVHVSLFWEGHRVWFHYLLCFVHCCLSVAACHCSKDVNQNHLAVPLVFLTQQTLTGAQSLPHGGRQLMYGVDLADRWKDCVELGKLCVVSGVTDPSFIQSAAIVFWSVYFLSNYYNIGLLKFYFCL